MRTTNAAKKMEHNISPQMVGSPPVGAVRIARAGPYAGILRMQQEVGNYAVNQIIQTMLTVSAPGDRFEHEADRVADQIVGTMPATRVSTQRGEPDLQRKCDSCASGSGKCESCAKEQVVQLKPISSGVSHSPSQHEAIGTMAPLRSGGIPLSSQERAFFEPRFNHDFRNVRIHTGAEAAQAAEAVNARAFTIGQRVVFAAGEYAPHTMNGQKLLAHELAHVIQQTGSGNLVQTNLERTLEQDADHSALGDQGPAQVTQTSTLRISRQPKPGTGTPAPAGTPAKYTVTETQLPNGHVRIRVEGTAGSPIARPGLETKYPLPKDVGLPGYDRWHLVGPDAIGAEEGIAYAPKEFNIGKTARIENKVRAARAALAEQGGGSLYFDFTADCKIVGDHEGVQIRVLEKVTWQVEARAPGGDKVITIVNESATPGAPTPAPSPVTAGGTRPKGSSTKSATESKPAATPSTGKELPKSSPTEGQPLPKVPKLGEVPGRPSAPPAGGTSNVGGAPPRTPTPAPAVVAAPVAPSPQTGKGTSEAARAIARETAESITSELRLLRAARVLTTAVHLISLIGTLKMLDDFINMTTSSLSRKGFILTNEIAAAESLEREAEQLSKSYPSFSDSIQTRGFLFLKAGADPVSAGKTSSSLFKLRLELSEAERLLPERLSKVERASKEADVKRRAALSILEDPKASAALAMATFGTAELAMLFAASEDLQRIGGSLNRAATALRTVDGLMRADLDFIKNWEDFLFLTCERGGACATKRIPFGDVRIGPSAD